MLRPVFLGCSASPREHRQLCRPLMTRCRQHLAAVGPISVLTLLNVDFRGFDSSIILILMGGIPRPMGIFPESLSQEILVGIMLVGRLGVNSMH